MIQQIYTNQELSNYFRIANVMNIICLLTNIIYHRYIPTAITIGCIIDNFDNLSLFITCLIVVSQLLRLIATEHKNIASFKPINISINMVIAIFFTWVLSYNNLMQDTVVDIYSTASITPHHSKQIIYLLILITIMLLIDLYYSLREDQNQINPEAVKVVISGEVHFVILQYIIFIIALTGIFHIDQLPQLSSLGLNYFASMLFLYGKILCNTIFAIWMFAMIYYTYKKYVTHEKCDIFN